MKTSHWIIGAIVVGGGILYLKYQSDQITKLRAVTGLPQQSFTKELYSSVQRLKKDM